MDWIAQGGVIAGAILAFAGVLTLLAKVLDRVNQILDTREDATKALNVAVTVEHKVDELHDEVRELARTTTDTFTSRTAEFSRIAHEAQVRFRAIEKEVEGIKIRQARTDGRLDAHSIEDDRRFERIETGLSDIRHELARISSAPAALGDPPAATPPV